MIYTSYFAKLRDLKKNNIEPIAICAAPPSWYIGLQYSELAPPYDAFMAWKMNHDDEAYAERYKEEVLGQLDAAAVVSKLTKAVPAETGKHIALVCYEKSSSFCHRHLVAEWLNQNG